jgi:Peptidase family S41
MIKVIFFLSFLLAVGPALSAQNCHCTEEFQFVKGYMEKNYAGFRDKVTPDTRGRYDSMSTDMARRIGLVHNPAYCIGLIKEWLGFFRDGHNYINAIVGKAIRPGPVEVIRLSPQTLAMLRQRRKGVEGIYHISDSTYKIAIIKSKTNDRDFAGVIVSSRVASWKPGQVKLELLRVDDTHFLACSYLRDHSINPESYLFDGQSLGGGIWTRDGSRGPTVGQQQWPDVQSRRLSAKTYYIGIGTFDESNAVAVDSLVHADSAVLATVPNLILDLRGNGGGSDFVASPLWPWIYTGPVFAVGVDVLATDDNVKGWSTLLEAKDIPEPDKAYLRGIISRMQAQHGQLISVNEDETVTLPEVRPFPKKIVVLINGDCASSAEEFLLRAMQSRKVTLMGQRTAGILDYANVRAVKLPCLPFTLHYATSRSRRLDLGKGIDNVGIQPDVLLAADKDWVEEARGYLEK